MYSGGSSSQPNSIFSTGGYPISDNFQNQQEAPALETKKEQPKDFASMMKQLESTTIKEKEEQRYAEEQVAYDADDNFGYYPNQFGGYPQGPNSFQGAGFNPMAGQMYANQNQMPGADFFGTMQQDPAAFANMLSQLTQSPNVQQ